jgi:hypothetical protein
MNETYSMYCERKLACFTTIPIELARAMIHEEASCAPIFSSGRRNPKRDERGAAAVAAAAPYCRVKREVEDLFKCKSTEKGLFILTIFHRNASSQEKTREARVCSYSA